MQVTKRAKSKTYWLAFSLSILTVAQAKLPLLQGFLAENYNYVLFSVAVLIAVLREFTTKPVNEK